MLKWMVRSSSKDRQANGEKHSKGSGKSKEPQEEKHSFKYLYKEYDEAPRTLDVGDGEIKYKGPLGTGQRRQPQRGKILQTDRPIQNNEKQRCSEECLRILPALETLLLEYCPRLERSETSILRIPE